ncbi:MAG: hypothetical protein ABFC24_08615, partial [Methanoregulaceae archaeon]
MSTHAICVLRKGIELSPTTRDRPFHLQKPEYADHSIDAAVSVGRGTKENAQLIRAFIVELRATQGIVTGRSNKIVLSLGDPNKEGDTNRLACIDRSQKKPGISEAYSEEGSRPLALPEEFSSQSLSEGAGHSSGN